MPRVYYEVAPSAYLFERTESPEEKVRQWTLFELLSTYGVNINDVKVEQPVKVGRRTHFADIVVLNSHSPQIVIECKRHGENAQKCIEQAISYASANEIRAEFAVATDGHYWLVRRKVENSWLAVSDISRRVTKNSRIRLDDFIDLVNFLKPLLFWIHRSIPSDHAQTFFANLQGFVHGSTLIFREELDDDLRYGTELLLRILSRDPLISGDYEKETLETLFYKLVTYLNNLEGSKESTRIGVYHAPINVLCDEFSKLGLSSSAINNANALFIRLLASLLQYLADAKIAGGFIDVPAKTVQHLMEYLEPYLGEALGVEFPDSLENLTRLRAYCDYKKWVI